MTTNTAGRRSTPTRSTGAPFVHGIRKFAGMLLLAATLVVPTLAVAVNWSARLSSGKTLQMVVEASRGEATYLLESRLADGLPDGQFGPRGRIPIKLGPDNGEPSSLRVDQAGRVLVTGSTQASGGALHPVVLRILPTGAPDPTWGNAGRSVVAPTTANAGALDALPMADGRVLVLGLIDDSQGEHAAVWYLTDDGRLDPRTAPSSRFMLEGNESSRGISVAPAAGEAKVMLAVRAFRGDQQWLEGYLFDPGDPVALPTLITRQPWPMSLIGAPHWLAGAMQGTWGDSSYPEAPPVSAVNVMTAPGARPAWHSLTSGAEPVAMAAANALASDLGSAAFNPFGGRGGGTNVPLTFEMNFAWEVVVLAGLLILAAVLVAHYCMRTLRRTHDEQQAK